MRNLNELLSVLRHRGVYVWAENGQLKYSSPTGGILPEEAAHLRRSKGELIDMLERTQLDTDVPLRPRDPTAAVPLTAFQWFYWKATTVEGKALDLRACISVLRIRGPLDQEVMRQSIGEAIKRHESLRTRIAAVDGVPRQLVDPASTAYLEVVDLTKSDQTCGKTCAAELEQNFVEERVGLSVGPLFKTKLIKLANHDHTLILALHQIISDGVSNEILTREIVVTYGALVRGRRPEFTALRHQFADFSSWQQRTSALWRRQHDDYWRDRVTDAPEVRLPIPAASNCYSFRGVVVDLPFGDRLTERLRQLARREHTMVAIVVLAVYVTVMFRWCGHWDLLVPFLDNGRDRPELDGMLGFLAQLLILRIRGEPRDSFRTLLERAHAEYCTACDHRDFTRSSVVSEFFTRIPTDLHFNWLPDHWMSSFGEGQQCIPELTIQQLPQPFPIRAGIPPQRFTSYFYDRPGGLGATVVYDSNVIGNDVAERFAYRLCSVADKAAENPLSSLESMFSDW